MAGQFRDQRNIAAHPLQDNRVHVRKIALDKAKEPLDRPGGLRRALHQSLNCPHLRLENRVRCAPVATVMKIGTAANWGQGRIPPRFREYLRRPQGIQMIELLRSNDMVLLSYVRALLQAENIEVTGLDEHASVMDGSVAMVQRRIMVDDRNIERARRLLTDAGLGDALKR